MCYQIRVGLVGLAASAARPCSPPPCAPSCGHAHCIGFGQDVRKLITPRGVDTVTGKPPQIQDKITDIEAVIFRG